jgi:hypothetical protein
MTAGASNKFNSGSGAAEVRTPFGQLSSTQQVAQANMMAIETMEAWLGASRQMLDLWRTSVREMQDGLLTAWRKRVVDAVAQDVLKEMKPQIQPPPRRASASRTTPATSPVLEQAKSGVLHS